MKATKGFFVSLAIMLFLLSACSSRQDTVTETDVKADLLLFLPAQRKAEHGLDLAEQLDGIYAVKTVIVAKIVSQTWLFEFKIMFQDHQNFFLEFFSGHHVSSQR